MAMSVNLDATTYKPSHKPIRRCTTAVLFAAGITMFVLGILGTQGIVSMLPGGAYAMIAIGSLSILGFIASCCGCVKKAGQYDIIE